MKKTAQKKELVECEDCNERKVVNGVEYCSLRQEYPNWYSTAPMGKKHDCNWHNKKK